MVKNDYRHVQGLTSAQVKERADAGQINVQQIKISKSYRQIFIENIFTLFNLFNLLIAAALIYVGAYENVLFLGLIMLNTTISIIQEIRSKRMLEKLSLLSASYAHVIRDGKECAISLDEIVLDDTLLFQMGNQICVDSIVLDGEVEMNESLLTGEADPIYKRPGDTLLSGSFIICGNCSAKAIHIGADNYAVKIASEAKKHKKFHSELMDSMNKIVQFTGFFIIPFGILIFFRSYYNLNMSFTDTVVSTAGALLGLMPKGLILLTTVSLVVGVIHLAKKKTLVHELFCIETLSRVDTLCLDKTGTLTKGTMKVSDTIPFPCPNLPDSLMNVIGTSIYAIDDCNATANALRNHFPNHANWIIKERQPFSSQRKWSAVSFKEKGSIFIGASDILLPNYPFPEQITQYAQEGKRLILIGYSPSCNLKMAENNISPAAIIVLEEELRDNVNDILQFFYKEDVTIKIISGDHPTTVASIAKQAGVPNADKYIDASTLHSKQDIMESIETYTVFGRVLPAQKKQLIQALKENGHTVAMTGDGVNDVLALKEADCSIAVASGSEAARDVSQLVLMDNDFSSLPSVVMEGRRVINNITRTASLFLVKTLFTFLLSICTIFFAVPYPFVPIHLSLISFFVEGIPSFLLAFEPNKERVTNEFMRTVLVSTVPAAFLIVLYIVLIQMQVAPILELDKVQTTTLCLYSVGFIWLLQLFQICRPFNTFRLILWSSMSIGFFSSCFLLKSIFGLTSLTIPMLLSFALLSILAYPIYMLIYWILAKQAERSTSSVTTLV